MREPSKRWRITKFETSWHESSGIETKLLLASDLGRSHTKSENRETRRPGRHFQVSVINEGNKVSNWCVAEISAAPHATRSGVSSHFSAPVDSQMLEVFTFSNAEKLTEEDKVVTATHPVPLLPHRELPLGWITLIDGSYYEESKSKGVTIRPEPPFDTLYWKVYCDEGRPSSGEYSLRELARQYDEFRSKYER
jgi:hypothetical protein